MGHREPSGFHSQVTSGHRAGRVPRRVFPSTISDTCPLLPLRTVLELGSGAGLTGLAICKMCHPRAYVFSDCHGLVLEQLRGNILLNGLLLESDATAPAQHPGLNTHNTESPRVTVAQLDWDIVTAPQLAAFQPDVIIAAGAIQPPVASICGFPVAPPTLSLGKGTMDSAGSGRYRWMRHLEGSL